MNTTFESQTTRYFTPVARHVTIRSSVTLLELSVVGRSEIKRTYRRTKGKAPNGQG